VPLNFLIPIFPSSPANAPTGTKLLGDKSYFLGPVRCEKLRRQGKINQPQMTPRFKWFPQNEVHPP